MIYATFLEVLLYSSSIPSFKKPIIYLHHFIRIIIKNINKIDIQKLRIIFGIIKTNFKILIITISANISPIFLGKIKLKIIAIKRSILFPGIRNLNN